MIAYLIPLAAVATLGVIVYAIVPAADRQAWFHGLSAALAAGAAGLDPVLEYFKTQTTDVWQTLGLDAKHALTVILGVNVVSLFFHSVNGNPNKTGANPGS